MLYFLYRTMAAPRSYTIIFFVTLVCLMIAIAPVTALDIDAGEPQPALHTIAQGDPVFVRGIATGHPQPGLQIWLIGNNYARVTTIPVQEDNSFEYELKPADSQNLAAGQYFVLIQHPMMNGQFDISYNAGTGQVTNKQLNGGMVIFTLTGSGSLQSSDAAAALIRAVNDRNIDDTFSSVSFFVDAPKALIDPIGEHYVGEKFAISGTTNLAAGDDILLEVYSSSFVPTTKEQSGEFSGTTGMVKVQQGEGINNRWSFDIDASGFKPGEYIVRVSAVHQDVTSTATFILVPVLAQAPTPTTTVLTPAVFPTTMATNTPATIPTTKVTPLPFWLTIIGITITGTIIRIKCRTNYKTESAPV